MRSKMTMTKTPPATSSTLTRLGDALGDVCVCCCKRGDHYAVQGGFPACSTCDSCRGFVLRAESAGEEP
jgi:hypothetical protein